MLSFLAVLLAADSVVGLWGGDTTYAPQVRGTLAIERAGGRWTARLGGIGGQATVARGQITVVLPDSQGEFRGRLVDGRIHGYWVQAPGVVASVRYATPATLRAIGPGRWSGVIEPLDDHYTLYLVIRRAGGDSGLTAIFRVPERNYWPDVSWAHYQVVVDGDSVRFLNRTNPGVHIAGVIDGPRLRLRWPAVEGAITLRRGADERFYPRPPGSAPYRYRTPAAGDDGWQVARARDVGFDEARLEALIRRVAATDPARDNPPLIQSLLVARHGRLVLDEYFYGFDADRLHDLRSTGKTFTSVMLGAAMDRGAPVSLQTPVYPLLDPADTSRAKARITVAHLLTHSTGLSCDDDDDKSPGNEDRMYTQTAQPDWYRFILDLPVVHPAGQTYAYCSGGMNLVGGVVHATTGAWLPAFFDTTVAAPLGIRRWAMNLMPDGDGYAGGGLYLRPRDLLKLGVAYLDGGIWNGTRLVDADWVRQSTAHQIEAGSGSSDGYAWHRYTLRRTGGRSYQEFEASGNGGQLLIVVPECDLVVVFTAANYQRNRVWREFRNDLVPNVIIPAIEY
jgi:CubicO group peptidase (beta-lactamase class C family)